MAILPAARFAFEVRRATDAARDSFPRLSFGGLGPHTLKEIKKMNDYEARNSLRKILDHYERDAKRDFIKAFPTNESLTYWRISKLFASGSPRIRLRNNVEVHSNTRSIRARSPRRPRRA
jgi:hypothetical protein